MNLWMLSIVGLSLHNLNVVNGSSLEEENKTYTELKDVLVSRSTISPFSSYETPCLISYFSNDNVFHRVDNSVASTSNNLQFSMPWNESPAYSEYYNSTNEFNSTSVNITERESSSLEGTTDTILENEYTSGESELMNLLEDVSYDCFEQCRSGNNFSGTQINILDNILEALENDISQDTSSKLECTLTTPALCVEGSDYEKNKWTNTEDVTGNTQVTNKDNNNKNEKKTRSEFIKFWHKLFLSIQLKEANKAISILEYLHKIIVHCTMFNETECNKGFYYILNASKCIEHKLLNDFRFCKNNFLKYSEIMYKNMSYIFSKNAYTTLELLNSFSMHMLCLFVMCMVPINYTCNDRNKNRNIFAKKKILDTCMFHSILEKAKTVSYSSWCNKLRWSIANNNAHQHILAFTHVFFLQEDKTVSSNLIEHIFKCYNRTMSIAENCASVTGSWFYQNIYSSYGFETIIKNIKDMRNEIETFKSFLENLMNMIHKNIISELKTVSGVIFFAFYYLGMLLLTCVGSVQNITLYPFLSFFIFQKFWKDCESNVCLEEVIKYQDSTVFIKKVNTLDYFFMFTYLRVCHIIMLLLIDYLSDLSKDFENLKIGFNGNLYEEEYRIISKKHYTFCKNLSRHTQILTKINKHRKKLKYACSVKKTIQKINSGVECLKKKIKDYKITSNDENKNILMQQYVKICNDYEKLFTLLNKQDTEPVSDE